MAKTAAEIAQDAREDVIAEQIIHYQDNVKIGKRRIREMEDELKQANACYEKYRADLAQLIADIDAGIKFPLSDFTGA